ncbi:hypothetical protein E2C01_093995 [Portunus trituberculatus]|uniref:Uncharacterized protein n=1 Tax=Portunus trituberculatus TaxID=210409 RepID=A0A5B7JKK5_PORTR|nr:hypothetical protein [Portunus trituberculatus]
MTHGTRRDKHRNA